MNIDSDIRVTLRMNFNNFGDTLNLLIAPSSDQNFNLQNLSLSFTLLLALMLVNVGMLTR